MAVSMDRYPLSDTAALVMLWASPYYRKNPLIDAYLRKLDLSAGKNLLDYCDRICPWYSEVIINRKHFVGSTVRTLIPRIRGEVTILNLGAGFSPLALELVDLLSSRDRYIEIDKTAMDCKQNIYYDLIPDHHGIVSCVEGDITDISLLENILRPEEGRHIITVIEGISYYISRQDMKNVISTLSALSNKQSIIFEHLKPCRSIREECRETPYKIFSHISEYSSLDQTTTYTDDEIRAILPRDFICSYHDMDEMELGRTGLSAYFPSPDSGWLSVAVAVRNVDS